MANYNAIKYDGFSKGTLTLLSTTTASSDSTISFTSGIDSTYKEYLFIFNDLHSSVDGGAFLFQGNASGGSGYDETITSAFFRAYHDQAGTSAALGYETGSDQAQGTGFQRLTEELIGNDNDQSAGGYLHLFNPSDTTYVKHFIGKISAYHKSNYHVQSYIAGYFNTTSAIDEIQFKMHSGNIDAGVIQLFGVN